ncbi:MAG: hypothetical protein V3S64_02405 [bacterium]
MELQHLDVKLPLDPPTPAELEALIPIFQQWIRDGDGDGDELLIDVADFRHVHGGPEVILIGHEGNYALDNTDGRSGLRYTRKTVLPGTNAERLGQAIGALAKARRRLEAEPALAGKLRFHRHEMEIRINDRHLAPNRQETFDALAPEIAEFFKSRGFENGVRLSREGGKREVLRVKVRADAPLDGISA